MGLASVGTWIGGREAGQEGLRKVGSGAVLESDSMAPGAEMGSLIDGARDEAAFCAAARAMRALWVSEGLRRLSVRGGGADVAPAGSVSGKACSVETAFLFGIWIAGLGSIGGAEAGKPFFSFS